ncbi:acyltransferase family protein [endosymbiont of unidentified scaly snail isolate Monju]|uniref:acyltransferase family protein n=1 Tax=endosymbiont of unidentified scaly snail isolate Monju TaxID=1248727 RepID=UPI0003892375|nr:acyltransferase family protein [endosymbiont of unidentified scaly snail isolate Monju]BAN69802.1 acyltransferase family protein [endosymbiont of unidentified scaly snail isolate Monju]
MSTTAPYRYRPDIDGLRAIAVLAVIAYHALPEHVPGGFVGVDVFFVISGFVITSVILRDHAQGRFSLRDFWLRRARRILPPLLPVMLFSALAAWFVLMPRELAKFGNTLASQALFASNIHFYHNSGYFDAPAQSNLLLHTRSLSVEEQFYILYPLLLLLLLPRRRLLPVLPLLAAASFATSIWLTHNDPVGAFYLPHSRAWELLLGALLAWQAEREKAPPLAGVAGTTGLLMIFVACWWFDDNTRFPGLAALLPAGGAALVILAGNHGTPMATRLLARRPLVGIGLVSYSLYLWHWPLLTLARHLLGNAIPSFVLAGVLLATLLLAVISWRFIENPVRHRRILQDNRHLARAAFAGLLTVAITGKTLNAAKGVAARFPAPVADMYEQSQRKFPGCTPVRHTQRGLLCLHGPTDSPPTFLLWGDSHMGALWPAFDRIAERNGWNYLVYSCPPVVGLYLTDRNPDAAHAPCLDSSEQLLTQLREIPLVFLIAHWSVYLEGHDPKALDARNRQPFYANRDTIATTAKASRELFVPAFRETVKRLLQAGPRKVVIVRQVPEYPFWVPNELVRTALRGKPLQTVGIPLATHRERQRHADSLFDQLTSARVQVLDPTNFLCSDGQWCLTARQGRSLYRDDDHLSLWGAQLLEPLLARTFEDLALQ